MNQLALGLILKHQGMDLTASKNSAWISESLEELRAFARSYPEFTMEQFRHIRSMLKRQEPTSPKTWGAFTRAAVKAGIIQWTGRYMNALSTKTHAHPVKVWRAA
jgi:hypothetical protein